MKCVNCGFYEMNMKYGKMFCTFPDEADKDMAPCNEPDPVEYEHDTESDEWEWA